MHMEPNHEGAASVPQTTGAPILPAERVYQDPSVPAGLEGQKRTVDSLHGGGCLLCDPGTGVRVSLCLAGKPTGALSAVFPRRRRYNLRRLFLYDGLTLHAETEDLAAQEQLWLVGAFHGLRTLLCAVLKWSVEIFQPILLHDRDCVLDCSGVRLPAGTLPRSVCCAGPAGSIVSDSLFQFYLRPQDFARCSGQKPPEQKCAGGCLGHFGGDPSRHGCGDAADKGGPNLCADGAGNDRGIRGTVAGVPAAAAACGAGGVLFLWNVLRKPAKALRSGPRERRCGKSP